MKALIIVGLLTFQTSAFADRCCAGSCWKDGCCPPTYGCSAEKKPFNHMVCFPSLTDEQKGSLKKDLIEVFSPKTGEYIMCLEE